MDKKTPSLNHRPPSQPTHRDSGQSQEDYLNTRNRYNSERALDRDDSSKSHGRQNQRRSSHSNEYIGNHITKSRDYNEDEVDSLQSKDRQNAKNSVRQGSGGRETRKSTSEPHRHKSRRSSYDEEGARNSHMEGRNHHHTGSLDRGPRSQQHQGRDRYSEHVSSSKSEPDFCPRGGESSANSSQYTTFNNSNNYLDSKRGRSIPYTSTPLNSDQSLSQRSRSRSRGPPSSSRGSTYTDHNDDTESPKYVTTSSHTRERSQDRGGSTKSYRHQNTSSKHNGTTNFSSKQNEKGRNMNSSSYMRLREDVGPPKDTDNPDCYVRDKSRDRSKSRDIPVCADEAKHRESHPQKSRKDVHESEQRRNSSSWRFTPFDEVNQNIIKLNPLDVCFFFLFTIKVY